VERIKGNIAEQIHKEWITAVTLKTTEVRKTKKAKMTNSRNHAQKAMSQKE
jgi:hypothetical protein